MNKFAEEYKAATQELLRVFGALSESDLDKPTPSGWTPRQVIHHLADSEAQSYARLRRLIAEPGTIIQGYDEEVWAENSILAYKTRDVTSALQVYTVVRNSSYELLLDIPESKLDNSCMHSESGEYSIRKWIDTYTRHPRDHANQILGK